MSQGADSFTGSTAGDYVWGNDGDDYLFGAGGNDHLEGGAGADLLEGGLGNDDLWGGSGVDEFMFRASNGFDKVFDFQDGVDHIHLSGISGVSSFLNLVITQDLQGNAVISFGLNNSITLQGVSASSLDASDFLFN